MNLQLPHPLQHKKSLVLVIVIIFGSALFISSSSIIYSINNLNQNLYGSGDDILVINNPLSNTPFTSNVAVSLESSILQIDGVTAVSPEIIVPILLDGESYVLRGVKFPSYNKTSDVSIRIGDPTLLSDRVSVFIDEDLTERIGSELNDILRMKSALNNKEKLVRISGVYNDNSLANDEFLTNIELAQELSPFNSGYTHYRVRFDPSITNKETVQSLILSEFDIKIGFSQLSNNVTEPVLNWKLVISNFLGEKIIDQSVSEEFETKLRLGYYQINATKGDITASKSIIVNGTANIQIVSGLIEYRQNIQVLRNGLPFQTKIEIMNADFSSLEIIESDENGLIYPILPIGEYNLKIGTVSNFEYERIFINGSETIQFDYSFDIPNIEIIGLRNGTVLVDPNTVLLVKNTVRGAIARFDGVSIFDLTDKIDLSEFQLQPGTHILETFASGQVTRYSFTIDDTVPYFSPDIANNSQIVEDSSSVTISMASLYEETINVVSSAPVL
ncbi:MAG: ABC transporter permease, partial [Candidatus Kariarchaeaceae archaeon]